MTHFSNLHRLSRLTAAGILLALAPLGGCAEDDEVLTSENSLTLGLLLPFTGSSAGSARNFERAVLLAVEEVNDAGGIHGKKLRIVARDTQSDAKISKAAANELVEEGALAVIGPESAEIAEKIIHPLNEHEVAFLSPVVGEGEEIEIHCDHPWFRLSPSAQALGDSLANRLFDAEIKEIAIIYGDGNYNRALRSSLREKYTSVLIQGEVVLEVPVREGAASYTSEIKSVLDVAPEAIVLVTSPETAAIVVTEYGLSAKKRAQWAFSPLLKTPLFLQNVPTENVEGAIGVAPKIFDRSEDFSALYSARWQGDSPLEGAYFYYDTVGVLTVALALMDKKAINYDNLKESLVDAASSSGRSFGWDELPAAVARAESGAQVNYSGLTGPLLLTDCGERRTGRTEAWTIIDGEIVEGQK